MFVLLSYPDKRVTISEEVPEIIEKFLASGYEVIICELSGP